MYYVIQFYKPTSKDRKFEEKFSKLSAVKRWQRVIKQNGYEVGNVKKIKGVKLNAS